MDNEKRLLSQSDVDRVAALFLQRFYKTLFTDVDLLSSFYSSNSRFTYNGEVSDGRQAASTYLSLGISEGHVDLSKSKIDAKAVFPYGVIFSVKGSLARERDGKKVVADITHSFLLLPLASSSQITYLIADEILKLGKEKIITPPLPPKPKSKVTKPPTQPPKPTSTPVEAKKPVEKPKPSNVEEQKKKSEIPEDPVPVNSYAAALARAKAEQPPKPAPKSTSTSVPAAKKKPMEESPKDSVEGSKKGIKVKKIPESVSDDQLKEKFSEFGEVTRVTRVHQSVAVIEFETLAPVEKFLQMDAKERYVELDSEETNEKIKLDIWENMPPRRQHRGKKQK